MFVPEAQLEPSQTSTIEVHRRCSFSSKQLSVYYITCFVLLLFHKSQQCLKTLIMLNDATIVAHSPPLKRDAPQFSTPQ